MKQSMIALILLFLCLIAPSQKLTVKELPPEPFPVGTCKQDVSGYIGITKNAKEETHLTDAQLGEYVRVRLSQGYSVALYPQVSGKVFAIATCESVKR